MDFETTMLVAIKWTVAAFLGEVAAVTAGPHKAIFALVVLMLIDWITGFTAAWINGTVSSAAGRKGLAKKGLTLMLILAIHILERVAQQELNLEVWGAVGYSINEGISIVENMDRAGVYIPAALVAGLQKVKGLGPRKATRAELDALRDCDRKID